jgi:AbrB family looped-hinge helix DNA binding protein
MSTMTSKGQVTIPKTIREALGLTPGSEVQFDVSADGAVLVRGKARRKAQDRFDAVRGKADVKWRTDDLMRLLRGDD